MTVDCEDLVGLGGFRQNDVVIAIMGPTGTGKSNLIDTLTEQPDKRVGHRLESCTTEVSAVRIKNHSFYEDRIVLVDTPGFNDTNKSDFEILEILSRSLVELWGVQVFFSGILYLHRITDPRITGTHRRTVNVFNEMCGEEAAPVVCYVTTTWDEVDFHVGEEREDYFKRELCKQMLADGASTARFHNTLESAWGIIDDILHKVPVQSVALQLQKELIEFKKTLEDTKAGQALFSVDVVVEQNPEAPQNARELIPTSSKSISDIEALYLKAIQTSASAAQKGLTFAIEAIAILNSLEDSSADKAEREGPLTALILFSAAGHDEAQKSLNHFREVRSVVTDLIASGASSKKSRKSEKSQDTAAVLEPLLQDSSKYVEWWGDVSMKQNALRNRCQRLIEVGHGRLYEKAVLGNFTKVKDDYIQYIEEIQNALPPEPPAALSSISQPAAFTRSKSGSVTADPAITEDNKTSKRTWSFRSLAAFTFCV